MGISSAETFYPGYSTARNAIGDLGASLPPNSMNVQPSATIFDLVVLATGLLVLAAAAILGRAAFVWPMTVPLGLYGLGAFLVGVFHGNWGNVHTLAAATAVNGPFRIVAPVLGAISLLTLASYCVLSSASPMTSFGPGGLERRIAYPAILFVLAFGGYLLGAAASAPVVTRVA
ncbi:MAG: DUF998 domain-containing protein [Methanospirillum sp.]